MKTVIISYDEKRRIANVIDTEDCIFNELSWDNDFEIDSEQPSSDCEDFNDNARWLIKTLLAILKLEKETATNLEETFDRTKENKKSR